MREYQHSRDWHWTSDVSNDDRVKIAEWILSLSDEEYEYLSKVLNDHYDYGLDGLRT